ncbi:helix-turn-helix transcriptional regulator [Paraburkholderia adhaesiva]|uniref:helix-turn-helix transcriptional regulator n=1 Tax=Paraburkholderia adhaesiva TaxID=2883244 RepID=UPI001F2A9E9E|nr:AlpA family transcriptional regulator [Paraburkholderia adhaesiva]
MSDKTARLIRRPEVLRRCGFSVSTLYSKMSQGDFPRPIHTGPNMVAWIEADVDAWVDEQIAAAQVTHDNEAADA